MSFFRPSSVSTSTSASPHLETGLTTLEDIQTHDLAKSTAGDEQTEFGAPEASPSIDEEAEGSTHYTPLSQAQSDVYTTVTPGLNLFSLSEAGMAVNMESDASSSGSSGYSSARRSSASSTSSSGSERNGSTSTVRTRATVAETQTAAVSPSTASTAVSPSVISTLPRIRLPEEDTLQSLLFEPSLPLARRERTHHRRRSSGSASRRRSVYKYHESGVSRDFLLIVALCTGFACTVIVLGRPAMISLLGSMQAGGFDMD
ncbi:hypothetical protein HYPSUDRAFT_36108 [Hypholoma sublateritium FD-334 SS-4]|uniref:Uncharacterized protein n=1 Tax=Hypholoma sublateritium (strain FD-334 SS-4) TaxID=945553 RepID=A0A0D2MSF7_HYPSF|nr:hypothetical protein HYPSUDRAFT_36108 [Hypholoma sublateritium FD-334 SS-4]